MVDINKFVAKWNGQHCEADGSAPGSATYDQCVDLIKEWEKENGWTISHGNALEYAKGEPGFTFTPNSPTGIPPVGAIVVFQEGEYGHVGIALAGSNTRTLVTFEQNDPLGSVCHVHNYNYINPKCLGWLTKN